MSFARAGAGNRRGLVSIALALAAAALIPVALAAACSPQAYLTLDKAQYAPGDTVRISGSFFKASTAITVSVDRTGQAVTVQSASNGAFNTTVALPANAPSGGYSIRAIGYEPTGEVINGLPARSSFVVATASTPVAGSDPTPQASAPAASAPAANAPQASAPAATANTPSASTRPTQRPATGTTSSAFREPAVIREPDVQTSTTRSTTQRSNQRTERATANGRPVFGGSVAPTVSATTAAPAPTASSVTRSTGSARAQRSSSQPAKVSPQAAEQTATDDVWGSLSSAGSPSVLPVAGDGVSVSSPRAGSQLALGIVMLGGGALALVGGLAFGEARRRRVRV